MSLNVERWPNVDLMLGQRRRRWANITSILEKCHRVNINIRLTLPTGRHYCDRLVPLTG